MDDHRTRFAITTMQSIADMIDDEVDRKIRGEVQACQWSNKVPLWRDMLQSAIDELKQTE